MLVTTKRQRAEWLRLVMVARRQLCNQDCKRASPLPIVGAAGTDDHWRRGRRFGRFIVLLVRFVRSCALAALGRGLLRVSTIRPRLRRAHANRQCGFVGGTPPRHVWPLHDTCIPLLPHLKT